MLDDLKNLSNRLYKAGLIEASAQIQYIIKTATPLVEYDLTNVSAPNRDAKREQSTQFTPRDQRLLKSPKTKEKLERWLKVSKWNIRIIFGVSEIGSEPEPIANAITLVLLDSNTQGEPLTPWIVLHRLGHALSESDGAVQFDNARKEFAANLVSLGLIDESDINSFGYDESGKEADILSQIFAFRSARKKEVEFTSPEFFCETVAEYLAHSKIRYNIPKGLNEAVVQRLILGVEESLSQSLDEAVGTVLVDSISF